MPCIDLECTPFAVLFHFVLLSVYMWSVPIMSGTIVLFKIGSLHLLFCPISCHTKGGKQKRFAQSVNYRHCRTETSQCSTWGNFIVC